MNLKELFYKYIKDKHLHHKGVSAEDLALALEAAGFLEVQNSVELEWTGKATCGEYRREFWKVIDSCKPSGNVSTVDV